MKVFRSLPLLLLLTETTALSVGAALGAKGIISKVRLPGSNYCHLRFPAIREDTLYSRHPVLQDPSVGDIIDFYGSCDHDPLGEEEIRAQKNYLQRELRRESGD